MLTELLYDYKVRRVCTSYYPHLTCLERGLILSQKKYHTRLLCETQIFSGVGFDYNTVRKYNTTGYCANHLSGSTRLHVRESMRLYCLTGESRYFVHRFHKDVVTDDLRSDIVSFYASRRDMTLAQISTVLSEKHGIRVPTYQISRIARDSLPQGLWRRKAKNLNNFI